VTLAQHFAARADFRSKLSRFRTIKVVAGKSYELDLKGTLGERAPAHYEIVYLEMELGSSTSLSILANRMTTLASMVETVAFGSPYFFFKTQNQRREIGIRRVARSQAKTRDPAGLHQLMYSDGRRDAPSGPYIGPTEVDVIGH